MHSQLTKTKRFWVKMLCGPNGSRTAMWGPYKWQKWTFQKKYNHFEKKFSKIDKKFVSQSILEVGHFPFQGICEKVVFFKTVIFCIGNPIVNLMDFDDYQ